MDNIKATVNWLRLVLLSLHPIVKGLAERATDHELLKRGLDVFEVDSDGEDCVSIYAKCYKSERYKLLNKIQSDYTRSKKQVGKLEFAFYWLSLKSISNDALAFGCSVKVAQGVSNGKQPVSRKHQRDHVLRLLDEKDMERADRYYVSDITQLYLQRYADDLGTRPVSVDAKYVKESVANRRAQRLKAIGYYGSGKRAGVKPNVIRVE
jgi:hypothetical protein